MQAFGVVYGLIKLVLKSKVCPLLTVLDDKFLWLLYIWSCSFEVLLWCVGEGGFEIWIYGLKFNFLWQSVWFTAFEIYHLYLYSEYFNAYIRFKPKLRGWNELVLLCAASALVCGVGQRGSYMIRTQKGFI